ncbi:MAG: glycosyltransferase family 4 protein [Acetobacteraceae bacterium]
MNPASLSVLLTHECFPPDFRGGGEYVVLRTAAGLRARGIDARVLTTGQPELREYEGIPTQRLPISRHRLNLRTKSIAESAGGADIIHTFNYHACLPSLAAGRRLNKPVVCEILALFGDAWRQMRGPVIGRAFQAWERFTLTRNYDRTIFLSDSSRNIGLALGASAEKSMVIAPGIDLERLACAEQREPFVAFAGLLDVRKGIHHLMAVARALPDIPFRALGWGDNIPELRATAPANLEIVEERNGPGYRDLISRALVILLPSHAETFGLTLAEAMASGCAIVSSIDTIPFAGARVAPGDETAMIEAIRRMWDDQAATAAYGRQNRLAASCYTWDAHIDRLLASYDAALRERRGA